MRPASFALLQAVGSLMIKMLLMHAFASLFMLLSQPNCREAYIAELRRRLDRVRRTLVPRPPVRRIPIDAGDLCAFCHEELLCPPPQDDAEDEAAATGRLASLRAVALAATRGAHAGLRRLAGQGSRRLARLLVAAYVRGRRAWRRWRQLEPLDDATHAWGCAWGDVLDDASADGAASDAPTESEAEAARYVVHCRWGCGKAVHRACAAAWGRNACVYCSAPMY